MKLYGSLHDVMVAASAAMTTRASSVHTEKWQGKEVGDIPAAGMMEVLDFDFKVPMPQKQSDLARMVEPNLPWAENHFQERIAGKPLNPGVQWKNWPWANSADTFRTDTLFTHTYMERFWPKWANLPEGSLSHKGIRYTYGDLDDVIHLLHAQPLTRQAFLPVFFPEDTGAAHGGRIPCTIGYHFMRRGTGFHMWYWIRSCDYYRHFRDDVYMAVRLADHILGRLVNLDEENWRDIHLGMMHMDVASLHLFINDYRKLFGDQKWK